MKLKNLSMKGFVTYEDASLRLDDLTYASVIGNNGAGKSTIFQAIMWAIYGSPRTPGDIDSVVNLSGDESLVELEIEADGVEWKISRFRRRNRNTKLRLYTKEGGKWVQFGDHLNKTAQDQIDKLVGITEDAWRSLVHMSADSGNRFVSAKSPERRSILTSLIPEISAYSEYEERIREALRANRQELDFRDREIERLEKTLEDASDRVERTREEKGSLGVEAAKKKLASLNNELAAAGTDSEYQIAQSAVLSIEKEMQSLRRETDSEGRALETELDNVEKVKRSLSDAERRLKSTETRLENDKEEYKDLENSRPELEEEKKEIEEVLANVDDRISGLSNLRSEEIAKLNGFLEREIAVEKGGVGVCYVCGSEITESSFARISNEIKQGKEDSKEESDRLARLIVRAEDEKTQLSHDLKEVDGEIRTLDKSLARIGASISSGSREKANLEEDLKGLNESLTNFRPVEQIEQDLDDLYDHEEARERELSRSLKEKKDILASVETTDVKRLKREIVIEERIVREFDELVGVERALVDSVKEYEEDLASLMKDQQELQQRGEDLDFLIKAVRPAGIPSLLLDGVLEEIEKEQNKILSSIPGSENFRVEFRTKKANKSGKGSQDVLDIIVHDGTGVERSIESFSSGERVRLTISNMFAMVKVFSARNPNMVNTIMLDEPLGVLDKEAVPAFVDVLRTAFNLGVSDSIIVISHDDKVTEALPQTIEVFKTDKGSILEVR